VRPGIDDLGRDALLVTEGVLECLQKFLSPKGEDLILVCLTVLFLETVVTACITAAVPIMRSARFTSRRIHEAV